MSIFGFFKGETKKAKEAAKAAAEERERVRKKQSMTLAQAMRAGHAGAQQSPPTQTTINPNTFVPSVNPQRFTPTVKTTSMGEVEGYDRKTQVMTFIAYCNLMMKTGQGTVETFIAPAENGDPILGVILKPADGSSESIVEFVNPKYQPLFLHTTTHRGNYTQVMTVDAIRRYREGIIDIIEAKFVNPHAFFMKDKFSDGYHTMSDLYEHRHALMLSAMSMTKTAWMSKLHDDGTMFDGSFIVGMSIPETDETMYEVTYHLPMRYWNDAVMTGADVREKGKPWDGHTPEGVVKRLMKFSQRNFDQEIHGKNLIPDYGIEIGYTNLDGMYVGKMA